MKISISGRLSLATLLYFSICSCSQRDTFIVKGHIRDVKDSVQVVLFHTDDLVAGHGVAVAFDTLKNGRFSFEVPVEGLDQYDLYFHDDAFSPDQYHIYSESGKTARVSGKGYTPASYRTRSSVKKQKEWNSYRRPIVKELVERRKIRDQIKDRSLYQHINDSLNTVSFHKQLPLLKSRKVTDIWMEEVHDYSIFFTQKGSNPLCREELKTLLGRLSEEQLKNELMLDAAKRLSVRVPLSVGDIFPESVYHDADGLIHHISDFRGKTVLLEFSNLGCAPCALAEPEIEKLCQDNPDDFAALCINMNDYGVWKAKAGSSDIANMFEFNDDDGQVGAFTRFGTRAVPTFVLLDSEMRISDLWVGYKEGQLFERLNK